MEHKALMIKILILKPPKLDILPCPHNGHLVQFKKNKVNKNYLRI